jgi:hypothetical protein
MEEKVPPADAPVVLKPITRENAGPMELSEDIALKIALENRLDLRVALEMSTMPSESWWWRPMPFGRNSPCSETLRWRRTKPGFRAPAEQHRSQFRKGRYNALFSLDLPIERTRKSSHTAKVF